MFKTINGGITPKRFSKYSAGFDVYSNEDVVIGAGETKRIGLGIAIDNSLIQGDVLIINEASALLLNCHYLELHIDDRLVEKGLIAPPKIVNLDCVDEIKMAVHNPYQNKKTYWKDVWETINTDYTIKKGDKIGQIILKRHEGYLLPQEYTLNAQRNGGFGSTGK